MTQTIEEEIAVGEQLDQVEDLGAAPLASAEFSARATLLAAATAVSAEASEQVD